MSDDEEQFGERVYTALRARGRRDALTVRFDYAGIQTLRAATRAELIELFDGSDPAILKALEVDTPEELACYLCGFADGYDRAALLVYRGVRVYGLIY